MNRSFALSLILALASGCSTPESRDAAPPPVSGRTVSALDGLDAATAKAVNTLRTADEFDSAHVGYGGMTPDSVIAFRAIVAHPRAAALFHDLLANATPAGKLYALSGLFFADPAAFGAAATRMAHDHTEVETMNGCIKMREPVGTVVRRSYPDRVQMRKGETLDAMVASGRSGPGDIAGGVTPLTFMGWSTPAPRDGV